MDQIRHYLAGVQETLDRLPTDAIRQVINTLHEARQSKRTVFIMGNGGSASTASHFVCDLAKNTRVAGWPDFRVIGLADNMALVSAYGNDEGYHNVFARQLAAFVEAGDVVIAISTSGNSPNVLEAVRVAKEAGAFTIGFTGFDGGALAPFVDLDVHVPSDCIEQVEDIHLILEHLMCSVLREMAQREMRRPPAVSVNGSGPRRVMVGTHPAG
ncbi:MAG: SIS domain-containing protein [Anaerolineae bacterium]|nr:SIS domain-containing protein [Anaerolineae bacterium]